MEQEIRPKPYAPIPKGIVKYELEEEPNLEEDQEECGENVGESLAYLPLPHGVTKVECQSGDVHDELNSGIQVYIVDLKSCIDVIIGGSESANFIYIYLRSIILFACNMCTKSVHYRRVELLAPQFRKTSKKNQH